MIRTNIIISLAVLLCAITGVYAQTQDTIFISQKNIGEIASDEHSLMYIVDDQNNRLSEGNYVIKKDSSDVRLGYFTVDEQQFLHHIFRINEEDLTTEYQLIHGELVGSKAFVDDTLFMSNTQQIDVDKNGNVWVVTIKLSNSIFVEGRELKEELVTVYHNKKPFKKTRYTDGTLASEMDFESGQHTQFDVDRDLEYNAPPKSPDVNDIGPDSKTFTYERNGKQRKRTVYKNGTMELYEEGQLIQKKVLGKPKDGKPTFNLITYINDDQPDNPRFVAFKTENLFLPDLTDEQLAYYRTKL